MTDCLTSAETSPGFANPEYLCMGSFSAAGLCGRGFIRTRLGFCHPCSVRLLTWERSVLVQTRRIALHEDGGPRRWDSVKSCCTECCIEQWILIVKNYLQSVHFLFSSNPMFKAVELQKMSRIWSQSCPSVDILSKLQIAASYQIIFNVHWSFIQSSF